MGKRKVTSSDVAKASGVSQATVSMILNRRQNVSFSRETVEKVEEAARELGYQSPGRKTRRDIRGQRLIVVFCPTLTNPYYVMLLHGIEEVAKEKGYGVFVCNTQRDLKIEENYLRMMKSVQPQGIIYTCNPSKSCAEQVNALAAVIPLVIINNREELLEIDAVELNNAKPGRLMARHLLDLGHRHVAFVSPPLTSRQGQRLKRVEGFVREFEEAGFGDGVIVRSASEDLDAVMPSMDSEYKMGYYLTKELLREDAELTAIAGMNDMIAFGIMDALIENKIRIPAEMSVLGCDNTIYSSLRTISLTTIDHYVPLKGRDACDIILRKIQSQRESREGNEPVSTYHVEYEPKLIVRKSTSYARTESLDHGMGGKRKKQNKNK
ncbi:MAG: LacI family DNA-binding transcriptional regulator [Fusicatenibacter sp.]|nr:LacI family DNA-binding transcriptional regulator [Lachnospiraceae bacterium]MDY2937125.1 LacI family DNA-binding transcriptional regulator [Fusicatenibacter sp.]